MLNREDFTIELLVLIIERTIQNLQSFSSLLFLE